MSSIRIPFQITSAGSVGAVSTPDRIVEQKIIDILTTARFERVMRPDYGSGAYDLLFEPVDDLVYGEFKMDALDEVNRNLTNASVVDLQIAPTQFPYFNEDTSSTIEITVRYITKPQGLRSFTFEIADTSLLTEESEI